jgi:hypothetical protein
VEEISAAIRDFRTGRKLDDLQWTAFLDHRIAVREKKLAEFSTQMVRARGSLEEAPSLTMQVLQKKVTDLAVEWQRRKLNWTRTRE